MLRLPEHNNEDFDALPTLSKNPISLATDGTQRHDMAHFKGSYKGNKDILVFNATNDHEAAYEPPKLDVSYDADADQNKNVPCSIWDVMVQRHRKAQAKGCKRTRDQGEWIVC